MPMHTDEYEISLYRELNVCMKNIKKLEKALAGLEHKYALTTDIFIEKYRSGALGENKDFSLWKEHYEGLKRWMERRRQYEKMFRLMKR